MTIYAYTATVRPGSSGGKEAIVSAHNLEDCPQLFVEHKSRMRYYEPNRYWLPSVLKRHLWHGRVIQQSGARPSVLTLQSGERNRRPGSGWQSEGPILYLSL
ncbi:hypothetical protein TNCV_1003661 [Trichonephila clavipes]|nr:hypothetical protein TNCV_1003661 [Trichonephila clavipes]